MVRHLAVLAFAAVIATTAWAEDRTETLAFEPGATSATIKGKIKGYDGATYLVETAAGQVLQVLFKPSNRSCYFNAFQPEKDVASHIGSIVGNEFAQSPTIAGTYRLQVYLMRNAARRSETCSYALSVELTGAPGGISPGVSDMTMKDRCKAEAAAMFGVQPRDIKPEDVAEADGFRIDATADKGAEGIKKLRCLFKRERTFDHIMALTSDGE